MWRLYIIYHRYIKPEFHQVDPAFSFEKIHLLQASGYQIQKGFPRDYTSQGYITLKESDFGEYDPSLQKKKYFAPSVLYHVYKNNWYPTNYIGFLEYDFELKVSKRDCLKLGINPEGFGESISQYLEEHLQKGRIIALSTRWRLQELNAQGSIKVGDVHWLTYFVKQYNLWCEASQVDKEALLKENPIIPTQQSFICDIESFKKIMKFIVYLIDNSLLEKSRPIPATLLERYIGLCIHLCDSEVVYLPLTHKAHHGYTL